MIKFKEFLKNFGIAMTIVLAILIFLACAIAVGSLIVTIFPPPSNIGLVLMLGWIATLAAFIISLIVTMND